MPQSTQAKLKLSEHDPVWKTIQAEAKKAMKEDPVLSTFIVSNVASQDSLELAIAHRIAHRLASRDVEAGALMKTFEAVLADSPELAQIFRADLAAIYDRDPACSRFIEPLLFYKGFHALQAHRFANALWRSGRETMSLFVQSQSSSAFQTDIHPAATIGRGIMFDHATGLVIGETASIGDNSSILHAVTLGGSGKDRGDRHPKIASGVMIGAGAKVLGNITVGSCSRVAAGSVVVKDVPPMSTVAGVPAKVMGPAGCSEPSRSMDQMIQDAFEAATQDADQ